MCLPMSVGTATQRLIVALNLGDGRSASNCRAGWAVAGRFCRRSPRRHSIENDVLLLRPDEGVILAA